MEDEHSYVFPSLESYNLTYPLDPSSWTWTDIRALDDEFPITPELQQLMDDEAHEMLLAMLIAEELGLNDFGKASNSPE